MLGFFCTLKEYFPSQHFCVECTDAFPRAFPVASKSFKSSSHLKKLSVCLKFDATSIATYRKAEFCDFS